MAVNYEYASSQSCIRVKRYITFPLKDIWKDIRSGESAVGFYYLVGEEDGRHIAYSKKLKKVVV